MMAEPKIQLGACIYWQRRGEVGLTVRRELVSRGNSGHLWGVKVLGGFDTQRKGNLHEKDAGET